MHGHRLPLSKPLLELMTHCKNSRNKRFILTTRDYILDQAVGAHEPLDRAKVNLKLSTVTLDDYSPIVRARLLANHLQFSSIDLNVLQAVLDTRAYATIKIGRASCRERV